jgi:lysophospholipase L1-like esterase
MRASIRRPVGVKRALLVPAVLCALAGAAPHPFVVALGDSITYGWALPEPSTQNYASLYADRVGAELANLAVPGYTCAQVRVRLTRMPSGASTVILNCGTNDIGGFGAVDGGVPNGHHRIPAATQSELFSAEKDFRDILSIVRKKEPNARIVVLTIRHWQRMTGPEDPRFAKDVTTWNAMIRKSGAHVVDIAADPRMYQSEYIQEDLIHPNIEGNDAIADDVEYSLP